MGSDNNDPPAAQPMARSTSTRSASPDPLRITVRDLRVEQRQEYKDIIQNLINNNPGLLFPDESKDILPDPLFFAVFSALGEDPYKRVCPLVLVSFKNNSEPFEPKNHKEAMANDYFKMHWQLAEKDEHGSLKENDIWELIPRNKIPNGVVILSGRWVYTLKRSADGLVVRYKARWVVRGFEQREGIDFNETFASVVKPISYKILFALAAANDWDFEQMDVKTAFLYGLIEKEVYVKQPTGWERIGLNGETLFYKLRKGLYSLKQLPRLWYNRFLEFMSKQGFRAIHADYYVFIHPKDGTIVALYVDNVFITGPSKQGIRDLKAALNKEFRMSDLGPVSYYLGITVNRDRQNRTVRLGQTAYLERVIREHGQWEARPSYTPMRQDFKPEPSPEGYQAPDDFRQKY